MYFNFTLRASSALHGNMLRSVLSAPLSWFHATPVGRILNRFGADQNQVDENLAVTLYDVLQTCFIGISAVIMTAVAIPPMLLLIPFLILYLFRIRKFVVNCIRELKRFESLSRSPMYETVNNSIDNLVSLRGERENENSREVREMD